MPIDENMSFKQKVKLGMLSFLGCAVLAVVFVNLIAMLGIPSNEQFSYIFGAVTYPFRVALESAIDLCGLN